MFLEERAVSDYRKTPGDKDLVCEQLASAIRYPSSLSYGRLKLLPFWDPLRGDPRFNKSSPFSPRRGSAQPARRCAGGSRANASPARTEGVLAFANFVGCARFDSFRPPAGARSFAREMAVCSTRVPCLYRSSYQNKFRTFPRNLAPDFGQYTCEHAQPRQQLSTEGISI